MVTQGKWSIWNLPNQIYVFFLTEIIGHSKFIRKKSQSLTNTLKNPLKFYQKVLWNWYHQNAWVFDWQHIFLYLVDMFFNRHSAYLWVQTVLLFSPTCSFISTRQTSYRGFSRKMKRSKPHPLISCSVYKSFLKTKCQVSDTDWAYWSSSIWMLRFIRNTLKSLIAVLIM